MNREQALSANDANNFSNQGLQLIRQGRYREGHNLIRQAYLLLVDSADSFTQQPKIERGLAMLKQMHQP